MWAGKQTRHSHTTAIAAPPVRQEKEISSWPKSKNYRGTTRSIATSSSVFQKDAIGQPGTRENDSLLPRENEILSCLVIMLKKRKSGLRPIQNFFFIISRLSTTLNLIQVFNGKFSIQCSSFVELRQVT